MNRACLLSVNGDKGRDIYKQHQHRQQTFLFHLSIAPLYHNINFILLFKYLILHYD
jgi:hypothetical protein